jgi:hypothetical protein
MVVIKQLLQLEDNHDFVTKYITKKASSMKLILASLSFLLIFPVSATHAVEGFNVWSSQELGLHFTYPPNWVEGTKTYDITKIVINWFPKSGKGVIASCALQATKSGVSKLRSDQIHEPLAKLKVSKSPTKLLAHSGAIF